MTAADTTPGEPTATCGHHAVIERLLVVAAVLHAVVWVLGFVNLPSSFPPEVVGQLRLSNIPYVLWPAFLAGVAWRAVRAELTPALLAATAAAGLLWVAHLLSTLLGLGDPGVFTVSYVSFLVASAALVAAGVLAARELLTHHEAFAEPPFRGDGAGLRSLVLVSGVVAALVTQLPIWNVSLGRHLSLVAAVGDRVGLSLLVTAGVGALATVVAAILAGVLRPARLGAVFGLVLGLDLATGIASHLVSLLRPIGPGATDLHPMVYVLVLTTGLLIGLAALLWLNVEGDTQPAPRPVRDPEREW